MRFESITTLATSSNEGQTGKRNKKTQLLSALLSASALGVFLEGCGGDTAGDSTPNSTTLPPPPLGSESNPFKATAAADSFTGSAGKDWVSYADLTDGVTIDLNTRTDLAGINNLIGSDQDDSLTGNGNANILRGGEGGDTLDGGGGDDWASYSNSALGVRVNLGLTGEDAQVDFDTPNQNEAVGDILNNIENIVGSDYDDSLTGNSGSNILEGGKGGDTLDGSAGPAGTFDWASYSNSALGVRVNLGLTGEDAQVDFDGADANQNEAVGDILNNIVDILGSDYNDWLTGNEGLNTLEGGKGDDTLDGGAGDDIYYFNAGDGTDTILTTNNSVNNNLLFTTSGTDYVDGDFAFDRGTLAADGTTFNGGTADTDIDLRIVVNGDPNDATVFDNTVFIKGYFDTGDNNVYTIFKFANNLAMIIYTQPDEVLTT